jgi:hypothetical protein
MKNLANILRNADIKPKDRIITLVKNNFHRDKNGENILTDSEIYSLTTGWKPKNSHEVNEYNKYLELSKLEISMRLDAQTISCKSENLLLRSNAVIKDIKYKTSTWSNIVFDKYISRQEAVDFAIKNTNFEYESLIHTLTFNNLQKEIRDDLLILDEGVAHDKKYLRDEVFLFELFKGSKAFNTQDKNILIDRIYSCIYSEGYRKLKNGSEKDGFLTLHFFAELPVGAVLIKWAEYANIKLDEIDSDQTLEILEKYTKDNNKTMEVVIKETLSRWIDEGLFTKEYIPLFFSNDYNTWNGNTVETHKDIFNIWYKEYKKTKVFIDKMLIDEDLKSEFTKNSLLGTKEDVRVVTGESLHNCKFDIDFIKEYKEQINILLPLVGMYLFIKKYNEPINNFKVIKGFYELSKTFSEVFDVDMSDRYKEFLDSFKSVIDFINISLCASLDDISFFIHTQNKNKYPIGINDNNLTFDVENEPEEIISDVLSDYKKEITKNGFIV